MAGNSYAADSLCEMETGRELQFRIGNSSVFYSSSFLLSAGGFSGVVTGFEISSR